MNTQAQKNDASPHTRIFANKQQQQRLVLRKKKKLNEKKTIGNRQNGTRSSNGFVQDNEYYVEVLPTELRRQHQVRRCYIPHNAQEAPNMSGDGTLMFHLLTDGNFPYPLPCLASNY